MKKWIILITIIVVLMLPAGLLGLMNSATGSRWLLQTIFSSLTAQVSAKAIEGRLLERIAISDLHYKSDSKTVAVKTLVFAWQPSKLFSGTLKIVDINVNGLNVNVAETNEPEEESAFDFNAEILLPVEIVLENLLLTDIKFQRGEQLQQLEKLHLSAFTEQGRLHIVSLDVNAKQLAATAKGQIELGKGFPMNLTADWRGKTKDYGLWQATTTINGDSHQLAFDNQVSSPFKLTLKGSLDHLQDAANTNITLRGDWQKLNWPLGSIKPQLSSEQGSLEMAGLLNAYQIRLNGELSRPSMPKAHLSFKGKGRLDALTIEKLELQSKAGILLLVGDVSWKAATVFDLTATGQQFNPAMLLAELPGSLTFNTRVKGTMAGKSLQMDAEINKLAGMLRGYPVSAGGKLHWAGEQLKIEDIKVVSGGNHIAVNGSLGQKQSALAVAVDAPALESFWPNLGGALKADGQLYGSLEKPEVQLQASVKRMYFNKHRADQLAIGINYHADTKKTSKIQLSASGIKTGTTQISKVLIDGLGTLGQHRFKVGINSSYGDLSSSFTGSFRTSVWQGDFSRLDLNAPDFGQWQLSNNSAVRIAQSPAGVDATWSETCLVRQEAALCTQGRYPANGNFQFKVNATALPASLMQTYLPEQLRIKAFINMNIDLQRQAGLLAGHYRLDVPANASITLKANGRATEIPLGASYLSGNINGKIISADLNLALAAQDYLRAELQLDTGETQTLSGHVKASVVEFALLNPFVSQLSNIKGNLKADLTINGNTGKPVINGVIRFAEGSFEYSELGLGFREIQLQALAESVGYTDTAPIRLTGSAKSGQGSIRLDGIANLMGTAELMLTGTDFEVAKIPEAEIAVSPELKLVFAKPNGKVTGQLKIPKAILKLRQLPENAVKVSSDEVILGEENAKQNAAVATNIDADIDVELGKQVRFSGQGLETELSGKLKISKTGEKMLMYGNVDMDKARYKSYGQDLSVRKGRFLFNGPVDKPWLDVEAIRVSNSKEVTAILNLTGQLDKPQTRLSSEPALPESEALAYLVTGKPLNQVSKSEGSALAGAALSYGSGQISWIAEKLGIDVFEINEGKTLQDTLVSVGQYLTPDFYVGTKVGLFNKQAVLVLKHKLTDTFNVETQTGTSQRIKLNYEIDTD